MTKLSASILSCNTACLVDCVKKAEDVGVHYIHIDIMDGRYVKNLSFGPQTIIDLKKLTSLPLEVHLELFDPENFLEMFADAGADRLVVQRDCCSNPIRILKQIRKMNMQAGIAINPGDSISQLENLLNYVDFIIVMGVEPGFGGQNFEESTYMKIRKLKQIMNDHGLNVPIAVDGGINFEIADKLKQEGVDILIVGSGLFNDENIYTNYKELMK